MLVGVVVNTDIDQYLEGQIIGMLSIFEMTKIGLRPVQTLLKPGRIVGNFRLCGRNVVSRKSYCYLKVSRSQIVETTVELGTMFNSEGRSVSTHAMQRALKGLGLNSCAAVRKPLISEEGERRLLLGSTKTGARVVR